MPVAIHKEKISIFDYIGDNLSFRYHADYFFDVIEGAHSQYIEIDFEGVEFASRSFVHQFLIKKEKSCKMIELINQNQNVKRMFHAVEHPKPKPQINACSQEIVTLE